MAYENKLLLMNKEKGNILTDNQLLETPWDDTGIAVNEVAYSARLNAILRQVTSVTHSLVQLAVDKELGSYGSYTEGDIKQFNSNEAHRLLTAVTLEYAENKKTKRNKNLVWATSPTTNDTTPSFRELTLSDLPTITSSKIGEKQVKTINIDDSAVTTAKIAAGNITNSLLADNSVSADNIIDGAVTAGKIADSAVTTGKLANKAVTFAKLGDGVDGIREEGSNYIKDSRISPMHSSVVGKNSDGDITKYNIVKMNLSKYNEITFEKKPNTLYFLV